MTKTAAIKTLGCKLNQFESEQMRCQLQQAGYEIVPFDGPADVYIINSCTVTSRTDRDCRRLAHGVKRRHPEALLIVTGCYAEMAAERLQQIEAIDIIAGNAAKARIAQIVPSGCSSGQAPGPDEAYGGTGPMITRLAGHTRAFIKVQEGCGRQCAYCIVTQARGPGRSVPPAQVCEQAELLAQAGHPELVLVGTHLGQYGSDLDESIDLATLLRRLAARDSIQRLRLSSLDPMEITDEIIEMIAAGGRSLPAQADWPAGGKLCRHVHISVQSGCDSVLARMNRPYTANSVAELVNKIKSAQPAASIGADIIVGFPAETEEEFAQTQAFIEELPFTYLHVFTYSLRPGTPAADMPNQLSGDVKKKRNHILREISDRKRRRFAAQMVGETLEAVVERFTPPEGEELRAISDNYLQVVFEGQQKLIGNIVPLAVDEVAGAGVRGHLPIQVVV